jgi:hypothetical protein
MLPENRSTVSHIRPLPNGELSLKVSVPGPGVVNVLVTAWKDNVAHAAALLQPAPGRFVYARARRIERSAGTLTILVKPNRNGLRLLAHPRHRITLRLWVTFKPPHGKQHKTGFYGLHLRT